MDNIEFSLSNGFYKDIVDSWIVFDNTTVAPKMIAFGGKNKKKYTTLLYEQYFERDLRS